MSVRPSCPNSVSTAMPQNDEPDSFKHNNTKYQTPNGQCSVKNQDMQQIEREDLNTETQSLKQLFQDVSPNQKRFEQISVEDENTRQINTLKRFLKPDAVTLFRMIKPGCVCTVEELPGPNGKIYSAVFSHEDVIQASGLGTSDKDAEEMAAENGIQLFVSKLMVEELMQKGKKLHEIKDLPSIEKLDLVRSIAAYAGVKSSVEKRKLKIEMSKSPSTFTEANNKLDGWFERMIKVQYPTSAMSWRNIDSFANLYVRKWHHIRHEKIQLNDETITGLEAANFKTENQNVREGRELPANAHELHAPELLNRMLPGICAHEISRSSFKIKMGYKVNNKLYTAKGSTKKEAKTKAAVKVMEHVYDFHYPTKKTD